MLQIDNSVRQIKTQVTETCSDVNKLNAEVVQIQLHSREHLERIEVLEKRGPPQASISQSAGCTVKAKSCIDQLDNALRRKNIVIANVPEKKGEHLIMDVAAILSNAGARLPVNEIDAVKRVGKIKKDGYPRPIICTFMRQTVRDGIYSKRNLIKANPKCAQMWINEDLSEETKENRANLRAIVDLANEIDVSARQVGDILIVNGLKYDARNLDMLPAPLSLEKAYIRETAKGLAFNSKNAYLSNFFPCQFKLYGKTWSSAEQAFMWAKASRNGAADLANLIRKEEDPKTIKRLGDSVAGSVTWKREEETVMNEIVHAKFAQNEEIAAKLAATSPKPLIEATMNKVWGAGKSIFSAELKSGRWEGANKLGLILVQTRRDLT